MESNLDGRGVWQYARTISGILWRLAIILLPWQTRWFSEGPAVNGFPWEQGRLSVYASWIVMAAVIGAAWFGHRRRGEARLARDSAIVHDATGDGQGKPCPYVVIGIFLLAFSSLFTYSIRATFQWWIEIVLLAGFVWSLIRLRVSFQSFATWFVISLIPHALLGVWQYHSQIVVGSKWLGMAAQDPLVRGVSVIESAGRRVLRAYGGFPHPNIFGGWLAVGILAVIRLIDRELIKWKRIVWMVVLSLFGVTLTLTFARGAWIACLVGCLLIAFGMVFHNNMGFRTKTRSLLVAVLPLIILFVSIGITAFAVRDQIFIRLQSTERLEQMSIQERQQGFVNGWHLFLAHPWVGVGSGASLAGLSYENPQETTPPIPPHFVPLLILDEVGIVGVIGLLFAAGLLLRGVRRLWLAPVATLFVLGLFDHYPWDLWSGLVLTALTIVMATGFIKKENPA